MSGWAMLSTMPCGWLAEHATADGPVLSSRVRLARSLAGRTFPQRARRTERTAVMRAILEETQGIARLEDGARVILDDLDRVQRQFLGERQLVSQELVDSPEARAVVASRDQATSFMVNEEDHLRIQAIRGGLDLDGAYRAADALDADLDARLDFAFSERFGFLTACPTNTGTGMRASVLVHLPGIVRNKEVDRVFDALRQQALTIRGFYGEGSAALGNFFQVSNATTLGTREADILDQIDRATRDLLGWEEQARDALLSRARSLLEDEIWRSYGVLRHARVLSAREALDHASRLRLGVGLGILPVPVRVLNEILLEAQPAHAQIAAGTRQTAEADVWRATMVREKLRPVGI
jgi:protein arginine kinase